MRLNAETEDLPGLRGRRYFVHRDSQPLSYAAAIEAWRSDAEFSDWLSDELAEAPFAAFRWETPPIDHATTDRPWEFVLLNSPNLARPSEPHLFAEHFEKAADPITTFANLGRNALLVAPTPQAHESAYGHLAAFVRKAPQQQRLALWQEVGEAMTRRLGDRPVWLSTAGAGVSWLHVRLDDQPKYYGYQPYRKWAAV
ncbi:DUF6940 family protein [Blastopirellula marina]|uniref:Uncharacterized protein n=1 Tax=Blastopirellula marina DSM 3645 TaxID=314230 RepID=A4A1Q7_9BACT|nr:hypothetical protein [Blastopirellula marina]EAQ77266.1 hypothetical protein DSM3645_29311 [Blastopirellula marina DSM 3645]